MSQFFDDLGNRIPVTLIQAGPCPVLKVKSSEGRDGYDAVMLGFGAGREKSKSKPELGVFKKLDAKPTEFIREVRVTADEAFLYPVGGTVDATLFQVGEKVDVVGTTRGHGFTGVMKRHGFSGFDRGHGTHECFRHGGSIGCRTWPGRTIKGMKMAGRDGNSRVTVLNLKVVGILPDQNLVLIQGAVPGAPNGIVMIRKAVKVKLGRGGVAR
jgi:large subunit ribosomal protein L3